MLPKVIIHNSISIDGSLTNFMPNMELHYRIAGKYKPDAHLVGSNTVKVGIQTYEEKVPPEGEKDFEKPEKDNTNLYWVIPDTKGALKGLLHVCRRFEYCKDVILLISEKTPKEYVAYLKERNYDYHVVGKTHVDLKESLELLAEKYAIKTVLTDTGRILSNLLLEQGLVSEISLLIHPLIVGRKSYRIFDGINKSINLTLQKKETFDKGYTWLVYGVKQTKEN